VNPSRPIGKVYGSLHNLLEGKGDTVFKNVKTVTGFFYEKSTFSNEDYISIQEWFCNTEMDAKLVLEQIKQLHTLDTDDFVFLPHWIWIRAGSSVYLIDSTESTRIDCMQEAERSVKMNVIIDDIVYFN
jgi:hypothetical protein